MGKTKIIGDVLFYIMSLPGYGVSSHGIQNWKYFLPKNKNTVELGAEVPVTIQKI